MSKFKFRKDYTEVEVSKSIDVLERCYNNSSRKVKIQSLSSQRDNEGLQAILRLAYDPFIMYGVVDFKVPKSKHLNEKSVDNFNEFVELAKRLSKRELTGNLARQAIEELFSRCSERELDWYPFILYKDLKSGLGYTTINSIWNDLVPTMELQLAKPRDEVGDIDFTEPGWIAEFKMDGIRGIFRTNREGKVTSVVSRQGKPPYNTEHIQEAINSLNLPDYIVDVELLAGNEWNLTSSITRTKSIHPDRKKLKAHIIDCIPRADFDIGGSDIILKERTSLVRKKIKGLQSSNYPLVLIERFPITCEDDIESALEVAFDAGFEGLILKNLNHGYECKRSNNWIKIKKVKTEDLEITGVEISERLSGKGVKVSKESLQEEIKYLLSMSVINKAVAKKAKIWVENLRIDKHSKVYTDAMGAFFCRFFDSKGNEKTGKVGSGYSHEQKVLFWFLKDHLIGQVIEAEAQDDPKEVAKIRFPTWTGRWRTDKRKPVLELG